MNAYFKCRKCGHNVFTDQINKIMMLSELECPECGEEGYENWIAVKNLE